MKKFNIIGFLALSLIIVLGGCKSWVDTDLNIDPNNPKDASLRNMLPAAQTNWAYIAGGDLGRYMSVWTQHHDGVLRQHAGIAGYNFTEADVNNSWNSLYSETMYELTVIIGKAENPDALSPHYAGVAKVMMANILLVLTDLYGDIPYTDAFKGFEQLRPTYDTQEEIYGIINNLLTDAISELGSASSVLSPSSDDFILGGDESAWIAFANTLKARAYVNLGLVDNANYGRALDAIDAGAISDNAGNAAFSFTNVETEAHPLYQFMDQRGDITMGKYFVDLLLAISDPRLPAYAEMDADGNYTGSFPGEYNTEASLPGAYFASKNSSVFFGTYAETKFIEAEAAFQAGNKARAAAAYNEGIEASLLQVVGSADAGYLADQARDENNITLADIMTHKYVASYMGTNSFTDWRRTGIPDLQPCLGQNAIPVRWPYPQSERLYNGGNVPGGITINTKLWWDKN